MDHNNLPVVWQGDDVVLVDVSDRLPKNENFPYNWRRSYKYRDIPGRKITTAWLHQKAGGCPGVVVDTSLT